MRNWSDEISDFLNAATTSSCVGSASPCLNDGPIVRVLKGQVTRIVDAINKPEWATLFAYGGSPDDSGYVADGAFTKMIKGQVTKLRNAIDVPMWVASNFGYSGNTDDGGYFADGAITKMVKGQVTRALKVVNKPEWVSVFDYSGKSDDGGYFADGAITKMVKGQVTKLMGGINKPEWVSVFDYSGKSDDGGYFADGVITKMVKGQVTRLVTAIDKPKWAELFAYSGNADDGGYFADGAFTKMVKGQATRLVTAIDKPKWAELFAYSGYKDDGGYFADGAFTKMIKGQVSRLVNPDWVKTALFHNNFSIASYANSMLEELRKSKLEKIEKALFNNNFSITDYMDSILKELRLPKLEKIEKALVSDGFSVTAYTDSILKELRLQTPLLKAIGSGGFDEDVIKIFEDIRDNIKKLGQTTGGKNIWDFLTELVGTLGKSLDSILDFVTHLGDWLIELVIPKNTDFITTGFNDLKVQFDDKLSILTSLKNTMTGMFNESGSPVQDYTIDLPIVGRPIKLLDMSIVAIGLPIFKKAMSGLIVIFTILHVYRKIVGNGGVMEK